MFLDRYETNKRGHGRVLHWGIKEANTETETKHWAELVLDSKKHYQHKYYWLFCAVGYVPQVIAIAHIGFFERICIKLDISYIILCKQFDQFAHRETSSTTIPALLAFLIKSAGTDLHSTTNHTLFSYQPQGVSPCQKSGNQKVIEMHWSPSESLFTIILVSGSLSIVHSFLSLMRITWIVDPLGGISGKRSSWDQRNATSPYYQMDCFKTEHSCRQFCSYTQKSLFWVLIWSILHHSRIRRNILRVFKCRRYLNCRTFLWAICDL